MNLHCSKVYEYIYKKNSGAYQCGSGEQVASKLSFYCLIIAIS
jgi:hypothetical protein